MALKKAATLTNAIALTTPAPAPAPAPAPVSVPKPVPKPAAKPAPAPVSVPKPAAKRTKYAGEGLRYTLSADNTRMHPLFELFNALPGPMRMVFELFTANNTRLQSKKTYRRVYVRHNPTGLCVRAIHTRTDGTQVVCLKHYYSPLFWVTYADFVALCGGLSDDTVAHLRRMLEKIKTFAYDTYIKCRQNDKHARRPDDVAFSPVLSDVITHAQAEDLLCRSRKSKHVRRVLRSSPMAGCLPLTLKRFFVDGYYYFECKHMMLLGWATVGDQTLFATVCNKTPTSVTFLTGEAVLEMFDVTVSSSSSMSDLLNCLKMMAHARLTPGAAMPTLDDVRVPALDVKP